ncbi:NitT/TauT family transport system permease protein [Silvibacterium bohemicum]|uniref:NitT/TauT family transport system permease protein n=1 Tax=Silvibacterium bohemicum TaxID=1577686 RepID=A0A841JL49_9BACT|nr:ABC transporter permease [Silvibacterium bohemicum]MBB6142076.1 NitT/TauT family transport system permease protein [Silvibacterium bohemicum]
MKQKIFVFLNAIGIFAALLLLWQLVIWLGHVPPFMLPSPWRVFRVIAERFSSLAESFEITATAATFGLLGSIVVGVAIALIFAQSRWVRRMFYPYTLLLQTVPIVAIAPLILMWVGAGWGAVTLIAFIICLAPIIANTTQGLISVDENLIHLFLMHNASRGQLLLKLRLRHAVPSLFVGIRISAGIAVIGAITGELFAGSTSVGRGGLGYSIIYALQQLQTDYLFALIVAATVLGFLFYFVVSFFEWYFLHKWHESARTPEVE